MCVLRGGCFLTVKWLFLSALPNELVRGALQGSRDDLRELPTWWDSSTEGQTLLGAFVNG